MLARKEEFLEEHLIYILKAVVMAGATLQDALLFHPELSAKAVKVTLKEYPPDSKKFVYIVRVSNPFFNDDFLATLVKQIAKLL